MAKGENTRTRILDVAETAILAKGFEATSIEEIVTAADITRSGFFYHYPDKNALARALLQRYIDNENVLFDDIFERAQELSDDPFHRMLISLKMIAEVFDDLPNGHPGCLIASACYQERLFDHHVQELNKQALLAWRARFCAKFEEIAERYPLNEPVDMTSLADMLSGIVEGGIILSRALKEPAAVGAQIMQFRTYVKLLFLPQA